MATALADSIKSIFGSAFSLGGAFGPQPASSFAPSGWFNHGLDLPAAKGTPVSAIDNGTVVFSGWAGGGGTGYANSYTPPTNPALANHFAATGGGNVVVIQDATGLYHGYAHLESRAVQVGQTVSAGTNIGAVGETGDATGYHLHYGIFNPTTSSFIDPAPYLESLSTAGTGQPLTFWKGVNGGPGITFPRGHILTSADVDAIIAYLTKYNIGLGAGDPTGLGAVGVKSLLTTQVGNPWNELLATNIQAGLAAGGTQVANALNPTNGIDLSGITGAITGIGIIFVGIALLIVAALVSRNSAPATA